MTSQASSPVVVCVDPPADAGGQVGSSWSTIEIATRPSRSRLRDFCDVVWVKKTISSPSSPTQTATECGDPSGAGSRHGRSWAPRRGRGPRRAGWPSARPYRSRSKSASRLEAPKRNVCGAAQLGAERARRRARGTGQPLRGADPARGLEAAEAVVARRPPASPRRPAAWRAGCSLPVEVLTKSAPTASASRAAAPITSGSRSSPDSRITLSRREAGLARGLDDRHRARAVAARRRRAAAGRRRPRGAVGDRLLGLAHRPPRCRGRPRGSSRPRRRGCRCRRARRPRARRTARRRRPRRPGRRASAPCAHSAAISASVSSPVRLVRSTRATISRGSSLSGHPSSQQRRGLRRPALALGQGLLVRRARRRPSPPRGSSRPTRRRRAGRRAARRSPRARSTCRRGRRRACGRRGSPPGSRSSGRDGEVDAVVQRACRARRPRRAGRRAAPGRRRPSRLGKRGPTSSSFGPDERVEALQVDVVGQRHEAAGPGLGAQRAGGVGEHEDLRAEQPERADRRRDRARLDPLVDVRAPAQARDRHAVEVAERERAGVARRRCRRGSRGARA